MVHLFDNLPTDVIYYAIFPCLDYHSRVTANLLLPSKDRIGTPLNKELVLVVSLKIRSNIINKGLKKVDSLSSERYTYRSQQSYSMHLLNVWRTLVENLEITQYKKNFRNAVLSKINEFMDPNNPQKDNVSLYTLKTLRALCQKTLHLMENRYPYLREVSLKN